MKISISSYSFQQYIKAGKMTQLDTVAKAHEMGFSAIEFIDMSPFANPTLEQQKDYARKIRGEADKFGMDICAYSIGANLYKETEEECRVEIKRLQNQLDVAKILGVRVMRHDACWAIGKTGNSRSFDLMLPTIAKNALEVTEYAKNLGIKTCVENHGYIAQDSDRMERLFNAVNHENFGLLVNFGNFACADEDSVTAVCRVAPYAVHVHAKDMIKYPGGDQNPGAGMTRGGNWFRCTVLGQGSIPVKQCVRIMKKAGYDGYMSIEFEGVEDCIYGISKGYENLKRYLAEVEAE